MTAITITDGTLMISAASQADLDALATRVTNLENGAGTGGTTPPPPPPPSGAPNLLQNPTDLTGAAWRKNGQTIPTVGPLTITFGTSWWDVFQSVTLQAGTRYTLSAPGGITGGPYAFAYQDPAGANHYGPDNVASFSFTPTTSGSHLVWIGNSQGAAAGSLTIGGAGLSLVAG